MNIKLKKWNSRSTERSHTSIRHVSCIPVSGSSLHNFQIRQWILRSCCSRI